MVSWSIYPVILYYLSEDRGLFMDCACPVEVSTSALPSISPSHLWHTTSDLHLAPLPKNHHLAFNPMGPAGVVVLNESAYNLLQSYQQPHPLHHPESFTLAQLQLLSPVESSLPAAACLPQPTKLTAWLHLTNACNLNCSYCYLNKTNEKMDLATGKAAVDKLLHQARQHGFDGLKLKYAGGEPTLNFELLRELHPYARDRARQLGVGLEAVMLSNGVRLTPEMLTFLQRQDIGLSISLDGLGMAHDMQRPFVGGQPSSHLVLRNIDLALEHGISPYLSITITETNADAIAEVAAYALERKLYFNLNFYRSQSYGNGAARRAANDKLIVNVMKVLQVIENDLPEYNLFANLMDRANFATPHTHTCGVGDNYLVIDHHGGIAQCHMLIDETVSNIWEQDPLLTLRTTPSINGFYNISVDEKESCSTCEWRYWCAGGCPLEALHTNGRVEAKSPYCDIYKAVFPEILRLEGLRLLKRNSILL